MTGRQKALFARCREGLPALSGPHLRLDGGTTDENDVELQLKRNGKPHKELVKIARPPIVAVRTLCDAGSLIAKPCSIMSYGQ